MEQNDIGVSEALRQLLCRLKKGDLTIEDELSIDAIGQFNEEIFSILAVPNNFLKKRGLWFKINNRLGKKVSNKEKENIFFFISAVHKCDGITKKEIMKEMKIGNVAFSKALNAIEKIFPSLLEYNIENKKYYLKN